MVRALDAGHSSSQLRRKTLSAPAKATPKPATPGSSRAEDAPAPAPETSSSTPSARPTVATAADARGQTLTDTTTQQLRARLDARLDRPREDGEQADAPAALARRSGRRAFTLAQPELGIGGGIANAVGNAIDTPEGFVENEDGTHTFRGTRGDDAYTVSQATSGELTVTNDATGDAYTLTSDQVDAGVTIWSGAGDDRITLDASVRADLDLHGGIGDDRIDAEDASGDLTIGGGAGDDILIGGRGDDDIDGHSGQDILRGGDGRDALAGGLGDDRLHGGDGNDQLLGQAGDDFLAGNDGEDFILGGDGVDEVRGGAGGDALYVDAEDTVDAGTVFDPSTSSYVTDGDHDLIVADQDAAAAQSLDADDAVATYDAEQVDQFLEDHPEFVIDGSEDFAARTRMDLGAMLSTSQGQGLLTELGEALAANGETLSFEEKPNGEAGGTYNFGLNRARVGQWAQTYRDGANRAPLPVLFHELVHAYQDLVSGRPFGDTTFENRDVPNIEREATGLPWLNWLGRPRDGTELPYTDNKFRAELGLPLRTAYSGETGDPTGVDWNLDGGGDHGHSHDVG